MLESGKIKPQPINIIRQPKVINIILACLVYGLLIWLSELPGIYPKEPPTIWLAGGFMLAVFLLNQRQIWWILSSSVFLVNTIYYLLHGTPLAVVAGVAFANTLEVTAAALFFTAFNGNVYIYKRFRDVLALIICAALVSNVFSSLVVAAVATFSFGIPFWTAWVTRWISNLAGVMIITPLVLTWYYAFNRSSLTFGRILKALGLFLIMGAGTTLTLVLNSGVVGYWLFAFLAFLSLMLIVLHFGAAGSSLGVLFLYTIVISLTAGNFYIEGVSNVPIREHILGLQVLLSITSIITAGITALMSERTQVDEAYRTLAENSDQGIAIIQDGRVVFTNSILENISGYKHEEFDGIPAGQILEYIHPEDKEKMARLLQNGEGDSHRFVEAQYRARYKNGSFRWVESTSVHSNYRGNPATLILFRDIHERKLIEDALRKDEEHFRELYEFLPVGYQNLDKNGFILAVNQTWEKALGYTRQEAIGHWFGDFLTPECAVLFKQQFPIYKRNGEIHDVEFEVVRKDGSTFIASFDGRIGYDEQSRFKQTHCIFIDITKRRQAEEALSRNEQELRLITDNMRDTIWLMDMQFHTTWISPSVVRTRGFTLEELTGMPLEQHLTPRSLKLAQSQITEQLTPENIRNTQKEIVVTDEYEYYRKDGSTFWGDTTITLLRDSKGRPTGLLGVARDTTERKRAEEALVESEDRLRQIAENMVDLIAMFDLQAIYQYASPSYEKVLGYRPDDLIGTWAPEHIHPDEKEATIEAISKIQHAGSGSVQFRYQHKDGNYRWFESTGCILTNKDGQPVGSILTSRDITDRKLTEEALRASEEKYRNIFENAPVGIFHSTTDGQYIDVNPQFPYMLGYDSTEDFIERVTETSIGEVIYVKPEDRRQLVQKSLESNNWIVTEIQYRRKKEGTITCNLMFRHMPDEPSQLEGFIVDITEWKNTEKALREQEARMNSIFRAAPIGIGMVINRVFKEVNAYLCVMSGYSHDELIGQNARLIYPTDEDYEFVGRENYGQISKGGTGNVETRFLTKDGRILDILLSLTPIDASDLEKGVIFTALDITKRKLAEMELQQTKAELENFFGAALDLFCIADTNGYYRRLNPAWESTLGYSIEELTSTKFYDFIHPDDVPSTLAVMSTLETRGAILNFVNRYRCKDGSYRWLEWRSFPAGKLIYAAARDITERRQAEKQMADSLQEKVVLLKEIHHRVKNNLNMISSLLDLQSERIYDSQAQQAFRESQNRIRSIARLHENLYRSRDLAQISAQDYIMDTAHYLLTAYSDVHEHVHLETSIENIRLDLDTAIPCGLILNELVSNCLKHAFPPAWIKQQLTKQEKTSNKTDIFPCQINVTLQSQKSHFELSVKDNGVGLPEQIQPENVSSLGLQLVYMLTQQLEGTLEIRRDQGTEFVIRWKKPRKAKGHDLLYPLDGG